MSAISSPTTPSFDLASTGLQDDPYPIYAWMRQESPVHRRLEADDVELWHCFRYDDVLATLRSPHYQSVKLDGELIAAVLRDPASPFHPLGRIADNVMLIKDGADHARLRGLVIGAFTPRMVEGLRPRIEEIVDRLLGEAARETGPIDLLSAFAAPLPIIVIAELLGIPPEDRAQLRRWSDRMATFIDGTIRDAGLVEAAEAAREMSTYLEKIFRDRRAAPRDDLISALVTAQEGGEVLDDDELLATVALVLGAGHETTTNLIGNGMLALLRHPDQLARLRAAPEHIDSCIEELLRFDSPVQVTSRVPTEAVEIGGQRIAAGVEVVLHLGAANRDPDVFPEPDVLDITRANNRHLSFGQGAHFCLGAALARLEGRIAIQALATRFPGLSLASEDFTRRPGVVLRGLTALPVRL